MEFHGSSWEYDTAANGAGGVAFVLVSGGRLFLKDPSGRRQTFHYGGAGVGAAAGLRLPKVKLPTARIRGQTLSGAGAATWFKSGGLIYRTDAKRELVHGDFQGGIVFVEGGFGLIAGGAGTAMLFGINPLLLAAGIANPVLATLAINSARGLLLMVGVNAGLQAGGAVGGLIGYMR